MNKYILSLIIGIIVCSCNCAIDKYQLTEFDATISQIANKKRAAWICIGDFNIINEMKDLGLSHCIRKFAPNIDFYFCDLSEEKNEHINYIYQLESLPVIMFVTPDKRIRHIINSNKDYHMIDKLKEISLKYLETGNIPVLSNSNFNFRGETLEQLYSDVYSAYQTLHTGDKSRFDNGITMIDSSIKTTPYFYNLYLGYKLHSVVGDKTIANQYYHRAITWFENNDAPLYTYLCLELVKENEGSTAEIELESQSVNLGTIPPNQVTTKSIKYKNTGKAPLIIINASTSCPCVQLEWTNKVMPDQYGEIKIHYHADDTKGPFHRTVIFVPNTVSGTKMLSIKGSIK